MLHSITPPPHLLRGSQVASVTSIAPFQLWLVCQPQSLWDERRRPWYSMLWIQWDHCNAPHVQLPLKTTQKLQLVHNAVARLLAGFAFRITITLF